MGVVCYEDNFYYNLLPSFFLKSLFYDKPIIGVKKIKKRHYTFKKLPPSCI